MFRVVHIATKQNEDVELPQRAQQPASNVGKRYTRHTPWPAIEYF